ncbi:WD40-repeat-containing domain protein [Mycena metata]|uniref:WD40-repeat-containing domain protein n=1 Tax=Mycena metata TaxID=1033252 RepID=A0AAD7J1V7_9AGAR|nr:WD40-repeat-containing domain protein [Mycena metata]
MPSNDGFHFLLASVELLKECSDWFGPLKSAAGGLHAILLVLAKHSDNNETMQQLGQRIEMIAQIAAMYRDKHDTAINNSLRDLARFIEKMKADLEAQSKRPKIARVMLSDRVANALDGASNTLNDIIRDLNTGTMARLRCPEAFYNSITVCQRGPCADGTREDILEQLNRWALKDRGGVLMLLGRAGYGKTSIAFSFCQSLEGQKLLGASFFCSRAAERTTRVSNIIPSLCYSLGTVDPLIIATIQHSLFEDPDIGLKSTAEQFSKLLLPVAARLQQVTQPMVVVIDGLDECGDDKQITTLLRLLADSRLGIKLLLTCRPEQRIRQLIRSLKIPTLDLNTSETPLVSKDISIFVRQQLVDITEGRSDFDEPHPWPVESDVSRLADLAHGMFLVASAACDYIGGRGGNIAKRLREVVIAGLASTQVQERLDHIYRDIIHSAFALLADDERAIAGKILAGITNLFDSLSISTLNELLDVPEGVRSYLSSFHSILRIGSGNDPLVGIGHDAFRQFFSDSSRSRDYFIDQGACNEVIFIRCLDLLSALKKNSSAQISPAVTYACHHWSSHLSLITDPGDSTLNILSTFGQDHLLPWLACMSKLEELSHVDKILEEAEKWAQAHHMELLLAVLIDARRFTVANFTMLSASFLTALTDAVRWSPTDSLVRQNHSVSPPIVLLGLPQHWGLCQASVSTASALMALTCSPNGEIMAAGSYNGIIQILDPRTLQVLQSIQGHHDCVQSLEFSSDGLLLVSTADDATTKVWDASLQICQELSTNADAVLCAVFSADSAAVVAGYTDSSICWWDRNTASTQRIFRGHDGPVNVVRLTSNGGLLVSASDDSTIRVWNVMTGGITVLQGHLRPVTSLLILKDTQIISSSNDGSVRVWDINSGDLMRTVLQVSSPIECFAVSSNNAVLAVGSKNNIHILDLMHGDKSEKMLSGHTDCTNALLFLPHTDGHHIISTSSDRTLRSWDLRLPFVENHPEKHGDAVSTGECANIYAQKSPVHAVMFSSDSSIVVTESHNHNICGWDLVTDEQVVTLQGNSGPQWSVATSTDGLCAASGSQDGQIHIYDLISGHTRHSFSGHGGGINTLAFSRDGQYLLSGSYDCQLKIWTVIDGSLRQELRGHGDWVRDATFTSSGLCVISGSMDKSVRIWSLAEQSHDILWGHSGGVNSVDVAHDDTLIVSAGEESTIIVWSLAEKSVLRKLVILENAINSVRFSPGQYLHCCIWTTNNWEPVMLENISSSSHFWSVAFSSDGQYVATGAEDGVVRIWSLEGRILSHELKLEGAISFPIWKVAFSGSMIVTASDDAVVRVWNVEERNYTTLPGSGLPDGSRIYDSGTKLPIWVSPLVRDITAGYSLSDDGSRIINETGAVCTEIPSTYRDYSTSAWHGSNLALGYGSGLVVLIKCN